ncbi:MAG TPA: hypothetical protein P5120_05950 [Spirochaetota bacterium]|nr:hypothetical protein [Spirochaetota bacterium]HPF05672.1 hypothetical protein [Spirochaetota bacterium]HPJ42257.1 hypothetical protein [Spirochaetota bacterium]HPR36736.1 hypothetical protein [Spirochaetota bacterium]HRX47041.1 hypothetical protein [Spirochaetota bacterium]
MNKILLILALGSLAASMYFFFIERDLFSGSITMLFCIVCNLIFAMLNKVNKAG